METASATFSIISNDSSLRAEDFQPTQKPDASVIDTTTFTASYINVREGGQRDKIAALQVALKSPNTETIAVLHFQPLTASRSERVLRILNDKKIDHHDHKTAQRNVVRELYQATPSGLIGIEVLDQEKVRALLSDKPEPVQVEKAIPPATPKTQEPTLGNDDPAPVEKAYAPTQKASPKPVTKKEKPEVLGSFEALRDKVQTNPVPEKFRITETSEYTSKVAADRMQLAVKLGKEKGSAAVWKLIDIARFEDRRGGDKDVANAAVLALGRRNRLRLEPGHKAVETLVRAARYSQFANVRGSAIFGLVPRMRASYPEAYQTPIDIARDESENLNVRKVAVRAMCSKLYTFGDAVYSIMGDQSIHKKVREEAINGFAKKYKSADRDAKFDTLLDREGDLDTRAILLMGKATRPEADGPRVLRGHGGRKK